MKMLFQYRLGGTRNCLFIGEGSSGNQSNDSETASRKQVARIFYLSKNCKL